MRYYQPLWEALKKHKSISINASESNHKAIARMISKEKDMDLAFKNAEGWRTMFLRFRTVQNKLVVTLSYPKKDLLPGEY